ncbi:MAG: glycosyltransferase [gamma proteobacterium symbiont of Bathyaustriella thionipta]|nr:glycosyltransferase [gamma proteobacterium symbiont of Bathyaustriella thionipta]MCU7949184.1 glycosyltransferase [gamma proteobacterium symbiont of Bathyaustriella thionipta]MCU7954782.1 glycosyltransferase [gamma proteobacterium symbiont of Bathyaustriella thionipta]MCU7956925.1 glycosyltransferase [gamma proteobacterium symbiont of Bathyaustriella thionipta]MCU7966793.1 glycosyltransferase [gamma proteobacterium symbiont of Bathyaustriella thionipta]
MKVLHVYRTFFPDSQGGLEEVIRQISINVAVAQVRVFSISNKINEPDKVEVNGISVYRIPLSFELASCSFAFRGLKLYKELVDWADIIHYHFPWPFVDILYGIYGKKKKSVVTYHSDIIRQKWLLKLYRPLMRRFLSSVDRIVATSPNYFQTSDILQEYNQKVDIIPIGLDEKNYPAVDANRQKIWRETIHSPFFLFIGVLRYYKGLHIVIEAAKNADYKIVIVGAGPIEQKLKIQAEKEGIDNILFLGYLDDLDKVALLSICRAVVFPSYLRSEAFGVTLLEGAMFAKPLISVEIGSGMSYVNIHNKTGLQVTPGNVKAFREAMDTLYYDEELTNVLGLAARKRFETLFTGAQMGKKYDELYLFLMNDAKS